MQTFKNYLNRKLENPDFKKLFEEECYICTTVLDAVKSMKDKNLSVDSLADKLDVPSKTIQALFDGDRCKPGLIERIYTALGLECSCRKLK